MCKNVLLVLKHVLFLNFYVTILSSLHIPLKIISTLHSLCESYTSKMWKLDITEDGTCSLSLKLAIMTYRKSQVETFKEVSCGNQDL